LRVTAFLTLCAFLIFSNFINAQNAELSGTIKDKADNQTIIGVSLQLNLQSGELVNGTVTDVNGNYSFKNLNPGIYILRSSFVGYETIESTVRIISDEKKTLNLTMEVTSLNLKTVTVEGTQSRMEQKGDTSQYNADAFKTNPDANAEDLITKMPGITTEGGTVKAGGEDVKRVLIDGKPFFGDDPNLALKNIPAEVIDKIQVFEQMSDQSQFTGFDDGQGVKTINIVTKAGKNNGQFGRVYAGYGEGNTYNAGMNLNYFKGDRRISILGLTNNINQQNFSTEDLVGALGSDANQQGPGRRRGGRRNGSVDASDFLVDQRGGISETNAVGINYSDQWGKKAKVTGSYFFNQSNRNYEANLFREFVFQSDSALFYSEDAVANNLNANHRINFRFEYDIDSSNSILIVPKLSLQNNRNNESISGINRLLNTIDESSSETDNYNLITGFNFENRILYRHKFKKPKRTLSITLDTDINGKTGEGELNSYNEYFFTGVINELNQNSDLLNNGNRIRGQISFTEPLGENSQLEMSYRPSITNSFNEKNTFNFDPLQENFSILDTNLSNSFTSIYEAHEVRLSYRYNKNKVSFMLSASGQQASLIGNQDFPFVFQVNRDFTNFLPRAMFNYKFSNTKNLRVFYRSSANAPSINQLQDVIDNRNPLFLSSGNSDLKQSVNHFMVTRFGASNPGNARNVFLFLMGNYTQDYVANSTTIARSDTVIADGTQLLRGSQYSRPVNLDGYFSGRAFASFGLPVKKLKSNLNFTEALNYNRIPALINGKLNLANNYNLSQGLVLSSNISENIDFNIGYTANYSIVKNSLQIESDNNYFSHSATLKINYILKERIIFNTQAINTIFSGLSQDFNQNFTLLNASLAYKLLKNKSLEARVSVYDLLNQNNSIARTVTETFIEDVNSNVLNRYFMFTLVWNVRNFYAKAPKVE
jgi:outer membrane receptor protein involved in Fe transport